VKKTAMPASMTGNTADLFNDEQQDILVTVQANLLYFFNKARFLARVP
jgi:hypothetical protein